jgi:hypothetical protein
MWKEDTGEYGKRAPKGTARGHWRMWKEGLKGGEERILEDNGKRKRNCRERI